MNTRKTLSLIICITMPLLIGFSSGYITSGETEGWFSTINKPSFNPPNYIFGPVWTCLYILMGVSLYLIWNSEKSELRKKALWLFGIQLLLNFCWSIIFFSLHMTFVAVIDIMMLWALILYMIITFKKIKPTAAYLNIPYLLWVSFASILNISIWLLNR